MRARKENMDKKMQRDEARIMGGKERKNATRRRERKRESFGKKTCKRNY